MTKGWICKGGHPYYRIDGKKICPICAKIAELGLRKDRCAKFNHTVPAGHRHCPTCERYRKNPWQAELDQNGEATCTNGHHATHETLTYVRYPNGQVKRVCSQCLTLAAGAARDAAVAYAEGRHERGETRKRHRQRKRLPVDFFDWVVALRLIEGKIDEVYDMTRGTHVGPTAMEKWVAYNSTTDDYVFTRKFSNSIKSVRWQWAEAGEANGWPPKTLAQAMAEL